MQDLVDRQEQEVPWSGDEFAVAVQQVDGGTYDYSCVVHRNNHTPVATSTPRRVAVAGLSVGPRVGLSLGPVSAAGAEQGRGLIQEPFRG